MSRLVATQEVEAALAQRLDAVAPHLLGPGRASQAELAPGDRLDILVRSVRAEPTPARVWLLCTAVSGTLPTVDDVRTGTRFFRLSPALEATLWTLDHALLSADTRFAHRPLQIVARGVVVEVDRAVRSDRSTGRASMVRRMLSEWSAGHDFVPVTWTEPAQALRALNSDEHGRLCRRPQGSTSPTSGSEEPVLVVPWRSVVVLPEVPGPESCHRLAALAQFSENRVVAMGYDCIPVLSADLVPVSERNRFAQYLSVVKHARRVACLGATSYAEFGGLVSALPVQGLPEPEVLEIRPPVETCRPPSARRRDAVSGETGTPVVLCPGSFEPRQNQAAVLHAAERLWRKGMRFELLIIGESDWTGPVPEMVGRLQQAGRAVQLVEKATASELQVACRRARFTVFVPLHEGPGLPLAESLAQGTPAVTTKYGSTGEIGEEGGALLVDPHDDEELLAAMHALLTDDELWRRLRRETLERPARTWAQFAAELWDALVAPDLQSEVAEAAEPW